MQKKVPNPDGKRGSKAHRDKIDEVANEINENGFDAVKEFFVRLFSGKGKFADVAVLDKNKKVIEFHQIGKTNKNGTPVSRERKNAEEIEKGTGIKVVFHSFKIIIFVLVIGLAVYFIFN